MKTFKAPLIFLSAISAIVILLVAVKFALPAYAQSATETSPMMIFDLIRSIIPYSDESTSSGSSSSSLNPGTGGAAPAVSVKSLRDIFMEVEQKVQIPARIIEGVLLVESPATFNFSETEIQNYSQPGATIPSCRPNACSAAGPMQMTTGIDNVGSSRCGGCGLNQCPNAWAQYGQGLQPCNLRDSIYAGAAKLKKDSGNKGGAWTQDQVYRAATSYYGSCGDNYRYTRLGGRTYCEFLWWYYGQK